MNRLKLIIVCFVMFGFQQQNAMELYPQNPNCVRKLLNESVQESLCYSVKLLRFKHTITPLSIDQFISKKSGAKFKWDSNLLLQLKKGEFKCISALLRKFVIQLMSGADPNELYDQHYLINHAIMRGDPVLMAFLLGAGARPNSEGAYRHDALCYAIQYEKIVCVRLLLLSGVVVTDVHIAIAQSMSGCLGSEIHSLLVEFRSIQGLFERPLNIFEESKQDTLAALKQGYKEILEESEVKLERLILESSNRFKDDGEAAYSEENLKPASRLLKRSARGLLREPGENWQPMFTHHYTRGGVLILGPSIWS